jgi:hypothetical protein
MAVFQRCKLQILDSDLLAGSIGPIPPCLKSYHEILIPDFGALPLFSGILKSNCLSVYKFLLKSRALHQDKELYSILNIFFFPHTFMLYYVFIL